MTTPHTVVRAALLAACAVAAACSGGTSTPSVCNAAAEPAVVVTLRDAVDDERITGATIVLSEGPSFAETMNEGLDGDYFGGSERPGTYRVEIVAAGYVGQALDGVVAPAGPCGPETQRLEVRLERATARVLLVLPAAGGSRVVEAQIERR